ncbi:hypothetical protein HDU96_002882, partial [Phlyctochytrium bullatum]
MQEMDSTRMDTDGDDDRKQNGKKTTNRSSARRTANGGTTSTGRQMTLHESFADKTKAATSSVRVAPAMRPLSGAGPASATGPLLPQQGSTQKQNASTSAQSSAPSGQSASGGGHVEKRRQMATSFSPETVSKFASLMARETTVKAANDQRPQRLADATRTNTTLPLATALLRTPEKPPTSERFQKWTYAEVASAAPRPAGLAATSPQLERAPKRAGSSALTSAILANPVKTPPRANKRARREDLSPATEDLAVADDGPWVLVAHKRRSANTTSPRRKPVADATLAATPKKSVIKMAGFTPTPVIARNRSQCTTSQSSPQPAAGTLRTPTNAAIKAAGWTPTPVMNSKGKFLEFSAGPEEQTVSIRLQLARDKEFAKELQAEDSISRQIAGDEELAKALQAEEEDNYTSPIDQLTQQQGPSRKGKEQMESRWPPINKQGLPVQEVPSTGLGTDGIPGTLATSSRPPEASGNIPRTLENPGSSASHRLVPAPKHKVKETVEQGEPYDVEDLEFDDASSIKEFGGLSKLQLESLIHPTGLKPCHAEYGLRMDPENENRIAYKGQYRFGTLSDIRNTIKLIRGSPELAKHLLKKRHGRVFSSTTRKDREGSLYKHLYDAIADLKSDLSLDDESRKLEILKVQNSNARLRGQLKKKVKNAADLMKDLTQIKSRVVFNEPSGRELTEEDKPKAEGPVSLVDAVWGEMSDEQRRNLFLSEPALRGTLLRVPTSKGDYNLDSSLPR